MNTTRFVSAIAMSVGLILGQPSFAQGDWSLAKSADGVKVYVRNVEGSPLREFRGEIQLDSTPEKVVEVLRDADDFSKWMPNVVASKLLKATSNEQYHYLESKAPWPVTNRDGVYHFTYSRGEGGTVIVRVEAAPDYVPPRDGKVRIPEANGQWKLVPNSQGVSVTYQMHMSSGGAIPSWLANQAVVDTPYDTLKALRSYLQASR
ncbi:START domain protein [Burkholderia pseudomallei MSHR7498]|nr:START domain-containing protein [Burkholderia pseudomallei]AIV52731.1 START domain protein [Burkholderia pseudomallei MSHR1153]KGS96892.1 START domain protein [Burkholderia pseudomallei MSHR7498]